MLQRPLAITAPQPTTTKRRGPADTTVRLARNVAALFGVPVPGDATGMRWVSDYNLITIGEISRGAPTPDREASYHLPEPGWYAIGRGVIHLADSPAPKRSASVSSPSAHADDTEPSTPTVTVRKLPGGLDEIARGTVQRYGPETKAALILAASDYLFRPAEATMRDVLGLLGTSDDGLPVADATRIALWAVMVAEVLRCQPALFNAAVRARAIQQAALTRWEPDLSRVGDPARTEARGEPQPSITLENPPARTPEDNPNPHALAILDDLMLQVVRPRLGRTVKEPEADVSNVFLALDVVARWVRHILHSSDRAFVWLRADGDVWWSEAYLPEVWPLATFIDEVQQQNPLIVPFLDGPAARPELVPFDMKNLLHRQRLRPRIPSLPELARLPVTSQRAAIETHLTVLRIFRECPSFKSTAMNNDTAQDAHQLHLLAARLFGEDDLLSLKAESTYRRMSRRNLRGTSTESAVQSGHDLAGVLERLHQAWKRGDLPDDWWIEAVYANSATVNAFVQDLYAIGDTANADACRATLMSYWREVLPLVGGLNLSQEYAVRIPSAGSSVNDVLPGLLHNYVGVLAQSPDLSERLEAITIGTHQLLPLRRRVRAQRDSHTPLRTTLQILLNCIDSVLPHVGEAQARELAVLAEDLLFELKATDFYVTLVDEGRGADNDSDFAFLRSFATGSVIVAERLRPPTQNDLKLVDRALRSAREGIADKARSMAAGQGSSALQSAFEQLDARLAALKAGRA